MSIRIVTRVSKRGVGSSYRPGGRVDMMRATVREITAQLATVSESCDSF